MSTHEDFSRKQEVKGPSDRSFGWAFVVFFVAVALWPAVHHRPTRAWALVVAVVLALLTVARPALLHPANALWMRFGLLLGRVINPILMAVVFYGAVTPIGWLKRKFGKQSFEVRFDSAAGSYWVERRPPGPKPETMSQQY